MADKVLDRSDVVSRLQRVFGEGTPNGRPDPAASATGSKPINTPNGPSLLPALRSRRKLQPILRRHFPQLLDQLIGNRRRGAALRSVTGGKTSRKYRSIPAGTNVTN